MANSLQEQLLKAGLITQQHMEKAKQPKPKPPEKPTNQNKPKPAQPAHTQPRPTPKPRQPSDLEQFYKERAQLERSERETAERAARERAARKKQTREQVRTLLATHMQNVDDADIRYNFVIGDNIKYLYVTEAQQNALAAGTLAITFLEGKRCLIPSNIIPQLHELDPSKLVVVNQPESNGD